MRIFIYILLLVNQFIFAQNFDKANDLYRAEKYEAAAQEYEKIVASGKESADVYFNLGNSYYKLAKVGPSIYNYEKALLLNPHDSDIANNLKFAQKMQIDEVKEFQASGISTLVSNFTSAFHYNVWGWLTIFSAFLFLAAFAIYYFTQTSSYKRISFGAMIILFISIFITASAGFYQKSIIDNEFPAIVYVGTATVKGEPNESATDAFILHEGTKVTILERLEKWYKIALADGNEGWIEAKFLRELK